MALHNENPAKHRVRQDAIDAAQDAFSGALVSKNQQSIPASTFTILTWNTESYDYGDWYASPGDRFFTIPAGVFRIRMQAGARWATTTGAEFFLGLAKDGVFTQGFPQQQFFSLGAVHSIASSVIEVDPGDEISAVAWHDFATPVNVFTHVATFFGIKAVR